MARTPKLRIDIDRRAVDKLAETADMARALGSVADEAAKAAWSGAPSRVRAQRGASITGEHTNDEAAVVINSSIYHWFEYGARDVPTAPFIRPNVQKVISRYGGRFKPE